MKKKCRIIAILMLLIILIANISLATETNVVETPDANVVNDDSNMEVTYDNPEDEIMLLTEDGSLYDGADIGQSSGDLYYIDENVQISEQAVYGDIYAIGEDVKITSNFIDGNVFVIGQNVEITSDISGYIFIMAQEATISGATEGMYALGDKINIEENANIRNDVKVVCDTFNLKGIIGRNLLITSENINIISREDSNPNIYGNMTYTGNLNGNEDLVIGNVNKIEVSKAEKEEIKKDAMSIKVNDFITTAITALIIIALVILLFNNKFNYENRDVVSYLKDIAIGFGALILIPILSIIVMITIIGLPVGIIAILLYTVFLCVSLPVASIEIGNQIFKDKLDTKIKKIFAGILVYVIIKLIAYLPVVGGWIKFLCLLLGFGVILRKLFLSLTKKEEIKVKGEVIEKTSEIVDSSEDKKDDNIK